MIGLGSDTNMNLVCMTIKEWLSYFWGVTVKTYTVCKMCSMRLIGSISFWIRIRPKASVASFSIGAVHASSVKCSPPSFTHSQRWICQLLAIFRQDGFGFIVRFLLRTLTNAQRTRGLTSALPKKTSLGHITSSRTILDQISSSDISTKHLLQKLNQTSEQKVWTKNWLYDQTSASRSAPNCSQHVSQHQHLSYSNNFNKFWVGILTRQGHINQVY